ncbi:MAG: helix-turn-helix domain-containing protein [Proteobacteria bacterium]|nr:helix-turn-helix domain-containing protein [Pseudomonadota bacterium]
MSEQFNDIEKIRIWLAENERSMAWLARQIGWSREMLSQVLNGHRPISKKLAIAINDKTGVDIKGPVRRRRKTKAEEGSKETEFEAAAAQLVHA